MTATQRLLVASSDFRSNRALAFAVLFFATIMGQSALADITSDLYLHHNCNESSGQTLNDASGNSRTGVLGLTSAGETSDPTRNQGYDGAGLSFDGSNDFATTSAVNISSASEWTFSAWVYFAASSGTRNIIAKQSGTNGATWLARTSSNGNLATLITGSAVGGGTISLSKWNHVAITVRYGTSATVTLYLNGTSVATTTVTLASENSAFRIGSHTSPDTTNEELNGRVDDVRMYTRALTQADIGELIDTTGMYAHWRMDESGGQTLNDWTGNQRHGVLGTNATQEASFDPTRVSGLIGGSLDFNGSTNQALTGTVAVSSASAWTFAAWVYCDSAFGTYNTIAAQTGGQTWLSRRTSDGAVVTLLTGSPVGGGSIPLSTWTHVAVSIAYGTGAAVTVYVNGIIVGTTTTTLASVTGTFRLGRHTTPSATNDEWDGRIDDVRVYPRNVDQDDIFTVMGTINSGFAGWWPMDEGSGQTVTDYSGFGRNGTLGQNSGSDASDPAWVTGRYGSALQFDGSNDTVKLPDSSAIFSGYKVVTMCCWVRLSNSTFTGTRSLLSFSVGASTTSSRAAMQVDANERILGLARSTDSEGGQTLTTTTSLTVGLWTHVAVVIDYGANSMTIYFDGIAQPTSGSVSFSSSTLPSTPNLRSAFGSQDDGSASEQLPGALDDVRIYGRALSASEVRTLAFGTDGFLVGHWQFEEGGTNQQLADSSGHGFTMNRGSSSGTNATDPTWTTSSRIGTNALDFDGGDRVTLAAADTANSLLDYASGNEITIAAWVNPDAIDNADTQFILTKGRSDSTSGIQNYCLFLRGVSNTTIGPSFRYTNAAGTTIYQWDSTTAAFGENSGWHHIAVTYTFGTGSSLAMYVDGLPVAGGWISGATGNVAPGSNDTPLWIGSGNNGAGASTFEGIMDDVRLYRRALSASEILEVFADPPDVWTGATNTDWNTATNWSRGVVPFGTSVSIPNVVNQPVISSTLSRVHTLTVSYGANVTLQSGGEVISTGGINVYGTLGLSGGAKLTMYDQTSVSVESAGSLVISGSASASAGSAGIIQSLTPGTTSWTLSIKDQGALRARGAQFIDGVITTGTSVTTLELDDVLFSSMPTGTTAFLDLSGVAHGGVNLQSLSFYRGGNVPTSTARNIRANVFTKWVTVGGYGGDLAGETFDDDTFNRVLWQNNPRVLNYVPASASATFTARKKITILASQVSGTSTDFPVLISHTDADLQSTCQADGDDIYFTDAAGTTIPHELESYNGATGAIVAWVKVPSVSSSGNTDIYMVYGNATVGSQANPTNVWDSDYRSVHHLRENPGGSAPQMQDSTSNGYNITTYGGMNAGNSVTGIMGNGVAFDGVDDYIAPAGTPGLGATSDISISCWAYMNAIGLGGTNDGAGDFLVDRLPATNELSTLKFVTGNQFCYQTRFDNGTSLGGAVGGTITTGQWRYVVGVRDRTAGLFRLYVDGVQVGTRADSGGNLTHPRPKWGLHSTTNNNGINGIMDELRISGTARSADWIQTEYNNQSSPSTFYTIGSPEPPHVLASLADLSLILPGVGQTVVVRSSSVMSGAILTPFNEIRGTLFLQNFAGTLVFDGIRFVGNSSLNTLAVDASAVTSATGNVQFYNCVFADLSNTSTVFVIPPTGGGACRANFCTVDAASMAAAGFTADDGNCLYCRGLSAAQRSAWFVDYTKTRDVHLTYTGATQAANAAIRNATYPRDCDGHERPSGAGATQKGAYHLNATAGTLIAQSDITSFSGFGDTIIYDGPPANNTLGGCVYVTGCDGTLCWLVALSRTDFSVLAKASWSGSRAGFPTFVQCSDLATSYWVYVSYDANGDGYFDSLRRVLHASGASTLTDNGAVTLRNSLNAVIDFTSNGGWDGQLTLRTSFATGATSNELQVGLTTQASNGQLHIWYVNSASTSGLFYNSSLLAVPNLASESYISGALNLLPTPEAPALVQGTNAGGSVILTRRRDSNSAGIIQFMRAAAGGAPGTVVVVNSLDVGTASGDTFTASPYQLFKTGSSYKLMQETGRPRVLAGKATNFASSNLDLSSRLSGFGGAVSTPPVGFFQTEAAAVGLYNSLTYRGAVAVIEYFPDQDGDTSLELLDSTYTHNSSKLQYDDDTGSSGVPSDGSFEEGIAPVLGKPTRLAWAPTGNTILFAATDAGLLYAWEAHGLPATLNAQRKGQLISGFPIRIIGGRPTSINFLSLSDATMLANLGLGATTNVLAVFTDLGQVMLVRVPDTP